MNQIRKIGRRASLGQQFQFFNELAYRLRELRCEDDAAEGNTAPLSLRNFNQQVLILREENPAQFCGPVRENGIFPSRRAVLLRGEHIDSPPTQAARDRARHMHVHVEGNAHCIPSRSSNSARVDCPGASPRSRR